MYYAMFRVVIIYFEFVLRHLHVHVRFGELWRIWSKMELKRKRPRSCVEIGVDQCCERQTTPLWRQSRLMKNGEADFSRIAFSHKFSYLQRSPWPCLTYLNIFCSHCLGYALYFVREILERISELLQRLIETSIFLSLNVLFILWLLLLWSCLSNLFVRSRDFLRF